METDFNPIPFKQTFQFACNPQVSCFNQCCRNLNQLLTPYDILRLKTRLGMPSYRFLRVYTREHDGPETGLPVVALKSQEPTELECPFVTPEGCRVYPDRPASCRIYPLARAISRNRKNGTVKAHYAMLKESHCHGHRQKKTQTVQEWIAQQKLAVYNRHNDRLIEIIALKNRYKPGPLDRVSRRRFHLAMYDLDNFRKKLADPNWSRGMPLSRKQLRSAVDDDTTLLHIGYLWIAVNLFNLAPSAAMDLFAGDIPNR